MGYSVKEIIFTLQGEGVNAGRPAVFCRFAGCNLWTGRAEDRSRGLGGCARWCDTDFVGTDGLGGGKFGTAAELAAAVSSYWPPHETASGRRFVVCTGGEPALQLDEALIEEFHRRGFEVAIETNGTRPLPKGIDWVCVSPKAGSDVVVREGHELKLVYPQVGMLPDDCGTWDFRHFLLQPMDSEEQKKNTADAVGYCLAHPRWRLSLQTHKLLGLR